MRWVIPGLNLFVALCFFGAAIACTFEGKDVLAMIDAAFVIANIAFGVWYGFFAYPRLIKGL